MVAKKDMKKSAENLALLVAVQMLGFIVLEVIVWLLVSIGWFPPQLILSNSGGVVLQINSAYLIIAGLMSLLVAGFWLAILTEVFGIVEVGRIKLKF